MHRFFCPHTDLEKATVEINDPHEIHHLKNVLRLKINDPIRIFNNRGDEIAGTILVITPKKVEVHRDSVLPLPLPKSPLIILACAIPQKSKFEFIVEKGTELGVDEVFPLKTERTEISLKGEHRERKKSRYSTVAVNAAKQCGRRFVPVIQPITDFKDVLPKLGRDDLGLMACLRAERSSLFEVLSQERRKGHKRIFFLIGPEGDFAPQEVRLALDSGFRAISLGANVLKVETAALAVLAVSHLIFS